MMDNDDNDLGQFTAVARIATMSNGANKIAAALLTIANWTGGRREDMPDCDPVEVVRTYKRMLREVEAHDTERGL